jgi:pimeloyl-ACP methyl ester carboxylesterase
VSDPGTEDRLLDVEGHRIAIKVSGAGAPPVVCLSSAGDAHDQWAKFVPLIQPVTSCITYGRPGLGGSDPLPTAIAAVPRGDVLSSAVGRWLRNDPAPWHHPLPLAELDQAWQEKQRQWVERLSAVQVIADTAGHLVHQEQPELAADVVRAVVAAAREGRDVHLDLLSVTASGGRIV